MTFARFSVATAQLAGKPLAQAAVLAFCLAWLTLGLGENRLTLALSIAAITLSQMVLGSQCLREADDRRRDIAMHAKLDELIAATEGARDDLAHLEDEAEDRISEVRL